MVEVVQDNKSKCSYNNGIKIIIPDYMDTNEYPVLSYTTERDIDLLFVEEFRCSDEFFKWFLKVISEEIPSLKDKTFDSREVFHSVTKMGKGAGESDIVLNLKENDRIVSIFIENKIDAQFQQNQPERYRERAQDEVENGKCDEAYCILMAPNEYLESANEVKLFNSTISYEGVIEFFDNRLKQITNELAHRLVHKKEIVEQSINKYRRGYSPDIDDDVTEFWQKYYQLAKDKYPSLKLKKPGKKPYGSTFIIFSQALSPHPPLPQCTIKHKLKHGKIDIEFSGWAKEQEKVEKKISALTQNNMQINKAGKSLSVSIEIPEIDPKSQFVIQREKVLLGLENAYTLLNWFNENINALQDIAKGITD